ncbi:hypothetical protein WAI453_013228 [Rhynchosporium graminicola]
MTEKLVDTANSPEAKRTEGIKTLPVERQWSSFAWLQVQDGDFVAESDDETSAEARAGERTTANRQASGDDPQKIV